MLLYTSVNCLWVTKAEMYLRHTEALRVSLTHVAWCDLMCSICLATGERLILAQLPLPAH